ncbi:carbon-nitrogen hydrolase [Helicobacter cetorum]|uniref:carbon-nitrogen hydrolase n=1 Tax=Helicobacter cetorum TaxID=138563 RepID=UPI000CF0C42E|nr:carbon-nitrogen hydrolase [Helicobacter cetorum]
MKIKATILQHAYKGSREVTLAHTANLLKLAKEKHVDTNLVVLQELHPYSYFCQNEDPKLFDLGEHFEEDKAFFSHLAKEFKVVLVTSLFEKRAKGLYHNTAVVFENDGSIAGTYRKMHIPDDPGFYEKFYFTPGDLGFEPISTSIGKLGLMVCWDQWYPEGARIMALKGAEILIYPSAIGFLEEDTKEEKMRQQNAWETIQRGHAIANGLPVIATNRVGVELDSSGVIKGGITFFGSSFIAGAQGEILAKASDKEEILYAEIDLERTEEVRRMWPFLRDRRIDSYKEILQRYLIN